ncbi:hypothetical protein B0O99DRAFT_745052 [Bisporella sp. PMI_857]|nr:hypothetical protein B0O99DRAFT_745052 [Bisporella sp. PMI_857]
MTTLRDIPPELREAIYREVDLQVRRGNNAPPLVLALAADNALYAEILPIYKSKNAVITLSNQQEFKRIKMKQLLKINHLKLQFPKHEDIPEPIPDPEFELELRANKCLLRNAFRTLFFDFTHHADSPAWAWYEFMIPIHRASLFGIHLIVVEFCKPIQKARYPGQDGLPDLKCARQRIDEISGVKGIQSHRWEGSGGGRREIIIWTWERNDGNPFVITP